MVRTPLIPGITDQKENIDAIQEIVKEDSWEKLDYNSLTPAKYERLGKEFSLSLHKR